MRCCQVRASVRNARIGHPARRKERPCKPSAVGSGRSKSWCVVGKPHTCDPAPKPRPDTSKRRMAAGGSQLARHFIDRGPAFADCGGPSLYHVSPAWTRRLERQRQSDVRLLVRAGRLRSDDLDVRPLALGGLLPKITQTFNMLRLERHWCMSYVPSQGDWPGEVRCSSKG